MGLASPFMPLSTPSPAFRRSQTLATSAPYTRVQAYTRPEDSASCSKAAAFASISSRVSPQNSAISSAAGRPCTNVVFRFSSMFWKLSSRILPSISSTAAGRCRRATRLASKLPSNVPQWAQTTIFSAGGNGSRETVISVMKAKVPSLPASSLHRSVSGRASSMA